MGGREAEGDDRCALPQCPFHGKIVPRDDTGRPLRPEDRAREQRQQLQRQAERSGGHRGVGGALLGDSGSQQPPGRLCVSLWTLPPQRGTPVGAVGTPEARPHWLVGSGL